MFNSSIYINDSVRLKVRFFDTDPITGDSVVVSPIVVQISILNSSSEVILNDLVTSVVGDEYYYDYTFVNPGEYRVVFTGIITEDKAIEASQILYVSEPDERYIPSVTLMEKEVIYFAPDVYPLYVDPESLLGYFPDASLLEIGERLHFYSLEIKHLLKLREEEDGSNLPPNAIEYIKASAACDLTRTYGFGGDDEVSLKLGDFSITNRSSSKNISSRDNAATWCQIAAALRREILTYGASMRGVLPKSLPSQKTLINNRFYVSKNPDDPMPKRNLKDFNSILNEKKYD
jgi:hypothetical protein